MTVLLRSQPGLHLDLSLPDPFTTSGLSFLTQRMDRVGLGSARSTEHPCRELTAEKLERR